MAGDGSPACPRGRDRRVPGRHRARRDRRPRLPERPQRVGSVRRAARSGQTRVTALDLVGCGSSSGAASWTRCTINEYVHDVIAVCDALDLTAPSPSVTASVGRSCSMPRSPTQSLQRRRAGGAGVHERPGLPARRGRLRGARAPTPDQQRALARAAFRTPPADDDFAALMDVIARATPQHIEGAARSMRDFTRQADLPRLRTRTLLVCGDRDRHVPLTNHLATQQGIPRCGLQVYHDVGHVPFVEVPDRFAEDVTRGSWTWNVERAWSRFPNSESGQGVMAGLLTAGKVAMRTGGRCRRRH